MRGGLTRSAARGATWFGISQALNQGLRFISMIVLARLLFPEDFGVVAMATIVTELALQTIGLGFGDAIIQRKKVTASHLSTAFWSGLALGIVFCGVTVAISPLVADFFGNELVGPVLAVSSLAFVIAPLRSIHGTLLMKRLEFFRFSIGEIGQAVTYVAVAVSMAFAGFGVWSIVLGNLAGQLALVILRWVLCRWHPSIMFSLKSLRDLWGFGSKVVGNKAVNFLSQRLGYFILGTYLSAAVLGFYDLGYRTANSSRTWLSMAVRRVSFPVFSAVQDEDERLRRGFLKSVTFTSLIAAPLFTGLAIVGPELVKVVFGDKWIPAVSPMQILCIPMGIAMMKVMVPSLFLAKGRPDIDLKLNIAGVALLVPSLLIGVRFGMVGVAVGVSVVGAILWPASLAFVRRLIGVRIRDYLVALRPAVVGSAVMAMTLLAFRYAAASLPDVGLLISSVLLGAITYYVALKVARVQALGEMIGLVLEMVRPYARALLAKMPFFRKAAPHDIEAAREVR